MRIVIHTFLVLCFLCAAGARGQTLQSAVVSSGATSSVESGMTLRATLGQPVIGATAAMLRAGQGFWYAVVHGSGTNAAEDAERLPASFSIGAVAPSPLAGPAGIPFTFRESGTLSLQLFDASGRLIERRDVGAFPPGSTRVSIDATGLTNGTYYLVAQFNGEQRTASLVVVQ